MSADARVLHKLSCQVGRPGISAQAANWLALRITVATAHEWSRTSETRMFKAGVGWVTLRLSEATGRHIPGRLKVLGIAGLPVDTPAPFHFASPTFVSACVASDRKSWRGVRRIGASLASELSELTEGQQEVLAMLIDNRWDGTLGELLEAARRLG